LSLRLWPIVIRRAVIIMFISLYLSIKVGFNLLILIIVLVILNWFKDVSRERDLLIEHSFFKQYFF